MPQHHVRYSSSARYVYTMRCPVAAMSSLRRMELLMFGPIMSPSLQSFVDAELSRETGWLEHVLGWWSRRAAPNVLIISYEQMVARPLESVRQLSSHMQVSLSEEEEAAVVYKMSKKYAHEHVDPYLFQASTPFSPPGRASKSGFIVVDTDPNAERLTPAQMRAIKNFYTTSVQKIIEGTDKEAAENAKSFYEANRGYFNEEEKEAASKI